MGDSQFWVVFSAWYLSVGYWFLGFGTSWNWCRGGVANQVWADLGYVTGFHGWGLDGVDGWDMEPWLVYFSCWNSDWVGYILVWNLMCIAMYFL